MNRIGPACFALLASLFTSLLTAPAAESPSLRTLAKGAVSGIRQPKQEVIKEQADWEKLWNAHTSGRMPAPPLPQVDFTKEMVIAVTTGTQRTGGYSVEIKSAAPADGKYRISIVHTEPRPGGITLQALTAPFHFVAVPNSSLPPEFVVLSAAKKPAR